MTLIHVCSRAPELPPYVVPLNEQHSLGRSMVEHFCTPETLRKKKHRTHLHIAILVQRGKSVAVASNSIRSRSKGAGSGEFTIHAESAVLRKLGDLSQLRDTDMYILRITRGQDAPAAGFSEPCASCIKLIRKCHEKYGLRKVYYSL